MKSRS